MKEPVITLTLEEYEELRKEHECLEKEHAELQRKYEASLQEYSRQVEEISACTAVIADLRWKLADLTRRLWGKSSEKRHLPEDAGQLSICFESPSDVNDPVAEEQKTAYLEELIMCLATVYKEEDNSSHRRMATIVSVKASRKRSLPTPVSPSTRPFPVRRLSFPCRKAFRWRERRSWERK